MVATSDAHYLTQDDYQAHDVLLCINTGKTVDQPLDKPRFVADDGKLSDQFHVRSPDEMYAVIPGHEEALAMSARIAERIEPNYAAWGWASGSSPRSRPRSRRPPRTICTELCEQGLRERYGDPPPPEARERLDHELAIINRMGFASYFLIVWDFVRYARERGIPGLGAGFGVRGAGQLRAPPEQRLPDQVRPPVRAVPRPQSLRGARYRHRPLPGSAVRGHRVRPQEVRRRQRGPDRHLRHDEGQGGHQGRRAGC